MFKTEVIKKHEHPLRLAEYPGDVVVYDDEEELIAEQAFTCTCGHCLQEINFLYRYYYKCDKCDFSSHTLCEELPTELKHKAHHHTLLLHQVDQLPSWLLCQICHITHQFVHLIYSCAQCKPQFIIGIECADIGLKNHLIYHPSHQHPIMPISRDILANCDACGNEHKGNFCHCTTCFRFFAHTGCVFTPKRLLIQKATYDFFTHTHELTLAYSFPIEDQKAKFYPNCKVCDGSFQVTSWIYKCERCRYYVHLGCTRIGVGACMSIISKKGKNYKDVEHPDLLHLPFPDHSNNMSNHLFSQEITRSRVPFPDHSNNMSKHLFFQESRSRAFETNITHFAHQHPLVLVDTPINNDITSPNSSKSTLICHNPLKKVEVLCNGCTRPIMAMPFYKCAVDDHDCNFFLHAWCTRLPVEIKGDIGHPQHTLTLLPKAPQFLFDVFECSVCHLACNGFAYSCVKCDYFVDVNCAFIPEKITHKSHPNHLLSRVKIELPQNCGLCLSRIDESEGTKFTCENCNFHLHPECALLLPETITHRYDKHPMTLSYSPVENHSGDYFCEACEEEFNPYGSFYHCDRCVWSVHLSCAPLILKGRPRNSLFFRKGVYLFVNIKFGDMFKIEGHPHPLSFCQGIENDGECSKCGMQLQDRVIVKCLQCKFAIDSGCASECDPPPKPIV